MKRLTFRRGYVPKPKVEKKLTAMEQQIAGKQLESETLFQRRDATVIPPDLIERIGKALDGCFASLIWDPRGECIRMAIWLQTNFAAMESCIPIFRIELRRKNDERELQIQSWSIERNTLYITTDLPEDGESFFADCLNLAFIASDETVVRTCRIADIKSARYL